MQTGYHGRKSFAGKILPASDCAPRILSHFPANLLIPIDQGGGGLPAFPQRNAPTNRCRREVQNRTTAKSKSKAADSACPERGRRECPPCTDKPATELHVVPFYESFFSQESYSCVA
jgi:hypothetical protein